MKKVALVFVAGMLIATMSACGANVSGNADASKETEASSSTVAEESPVAAEPETEEPTKTESEETEKSETETEEPEDSSPVTASIITDETLKEAAEESGEIRGGTNQNDAVLLPMDTKLYGTVRDKVPSWFAFTTREVENAVYRISAINKSRETCDVYVEVYDEYGNQITDLRAATNGIASTRDVTGLSADTTYYIRVIQDQNTNKHTIHYMIKIKNPDESSNAYQTAGTVLEARGEATALEGSINPGTNQDDAAYIPLNAKISGMVSDKVGAWFAFTTNTTENGAYRMTAVNESAGTTELFAEVYDEYGHMMGDLAAKAEGTASTASIENLSPGTTYYIRVIQNGNTNKYTIHYTLNIQAPEEPETQTATVEATEEDLVFETPFELNSTQVMFVANKAVFIDEEAAKTALEPVAEVILAHPDHPILLAGTTATDGTQESCVDLSNRRAAAVKDLLVSAFGVPESQIQTIGLGYEADPFVRGKDRDANGKFVESEGAKNRRVVVLDIEDPIAKELLEQ
jgi:outer membrane protein OmpA-like peptidoglycan-associated protein